MGWTNPRTWVAGEIPTAQQFNTHVRDNLAFLKERVQAGTTEITPVANVPTSVIVTFPIPFASPPRVIISPASTVIGTTVLGVGADEETNTQFRATVLRTNTTLTGVRWLATQLDA